MAVDPNSIAFAHRLADAAGEVIRPYFRKRVDVIDKSDGSPVTEADRNAEEAIRKLIEAEFPEDGIVGEEHGTKEGSTGRTWIIDPIDGTAAFITGRPTWGTLIALSVEGKPVLGLIDQPVLKERFVGHDGQASFISPAGTEILRARKCASLREAMVSTTHPWKYFSDAQRNQFEKVCAASRASYFGGDCYAYGLLALGFIDIILEGNLKPWDVAALIPIIEGAGGVVSDWEGTPFTTGGNIIASGDLRVHADALKILRG